MDPFKTITSGLVKEAIQRTSSGVKRAGKRYDDLKHIFVEDLTDNDILKIAQKSVGEKNLRMAQNIEWGIDERPDINIIKDITNQVFGNYLHKKYSTKQTGDIVLDRKVGKEFRENPASIYFRLQYQRKLIPFNDPKASNTIAATLESLEKACPGFMDFFNYFDSNNIPIKPFAHCTIFGYIEGEEGILSEDIPSEYKQKLRPVKKEDLEKFVSKEYGRHAREMAVYFQKYGIDPSTFYKTHLEKFQSGARGITPAEQEAYDEAFMNHVISRDFRSEKKLDRSLPVLKNYFKFHLLMQRIANIKGDLQSAAKHGGYISEGNFGRHRTTPNMNFYDVLDEAKKEVANLDENSPAAQEIIRQYNQDLAGAKVKTSGELALDRRNNTPRLFTFGQIMGTWSAEVFWGAILNAISKGYIFSKKVLDRELSNSRNEQIDVVGVPQNKVLKAPVQKGKTREIDADLYRKRLQNISSAYTSAKNGKIDEAKDALPYIEDISLLFKSLIPSDLMDEEKNVDTEALEEFYESNEPMYQSSIYMDFFANGWDTYPGVRGANPMPLFPPMRQVGPAFEKKNDGINVIYDRDGGNFGRRHLVHYWGWDQQENSLSYILKTFGPAAVQWLSALRKIAQTAGPNNYNPGSDTPEIILSEACRNVLTNRTSAECLIDEMIHNNNFDEFVQNHINCPAKPESQTGERTPSVNAQEKNSRTGLAMGAVNRATSLDNRQQEQIRIDQYKKQAWGLLTQYGYPVAKIMDLTSALITRSCRESLNKVIGGTDFIHGRRMTSSSGIGGGGNILLGIRYAYSATFEDLSKDPELRTLAQETFKKMKIRSKDYAGVRKTDWPEASENVNPSRSGIGPMAPLSTDQDTRRLNQILMESPDVPGWTPPKGTVRTKSGLVLVENIEYFVGQAGLQTGMLKDVLGDRSTRSNVSWEDALNRFVSLWPEADKFLNSYGDIIPGIQADLANVEKTIKKALDEVRNQYEKEQNDLVTLILKEANGNTEILMSHDISLAPDQTEEEIKAQPHENLPESAVVGPTAPQQSMEPQPTEISVAPMEPQPTDMGQPEPVGVGTSPQNPVAPVIPPKKPRGPKKPKPFPTAGTDPTDLLIKTADYLDHEGLLSISDKLDYIVKLVKWDK